MRKARQNIIAYVNSPNRRAGFAPEGIVLHAMMCSYERCIDLFTDPATDVSAHFVVAQDGRRAQMVPLPHPRGCFQWDNGCQAWHCMSGNNRYFGIEHEGNAGPEDWTEDMLRASAEISAYLCLTYKIPIVGPPATSGIRKWYLGIGGHDNVPENDHTDPGEDFPWTQYLSLIQQYANGHGPAVPLKCHTRQPRYKRDARLWVGKRLPLKRDVGGARAAPPP